MLATQMCEYHIRQSQSVAWCAIEPHSSVAVIEYRHLSPFTTTRTNACVLAFAGGRLARLFTNVLCMYVSCACVCAVGVFSQASGRVDVSCACMTVMCVLSRTCIALTSRVRARRVRVVTSVRACVRVDVLCVCALCACCHERVCVLTSRVRA